MSYFDKRCQISLKSPNLVIWKKTEKSRTSISLIYLSRIPRNMLNLQYFPETEHLYMISCIITGVSRM